MTDDITVIERDGIGPEMTDATLPLFGDLADRREFDVRTMEYD